MNLLIVDDQKAVVEGVRNSVDWATIGIDNVYTACSAKEAKLILPNFDIDILLSDIEMPEEDGLSLLRWTKKRFPEIVGVFLTSHADFDYAREALQIGSFDYILQPARSEEIRDVIARAVKTAQKNARISHLEKIGKVIEDQRDGMLELMLLKAEAEEWSDCKALYGRLLESMQTPEGADGFHVCSTKIYRYGGKAENWEEVLLRGIFRNVLEEIFAMYGARVIVTRVKDNEYMVLLNSLGGHLTQTEWEKGIEEFYRFATEQMDFSMALYFESEPLAEFSVVSYQNIRTRIDGNVSKQPGIYSNDSLQQDVDVNIERIKSAENYIRSNLGRGVSRSEVAEYLHLNEEYFSRLFKKYTGYTFKDYEMRVRMDQARKLLEHSRISVSIIASKVGYDNFSHFSRAFKKDTGMTPQEYRREKTGK